MHRRIYIRGCVRPSVGPSIGLFLFISVGLLFLGYFQRWKACILGTSCAVLPAFLMRGLAFIERNRGYERVNERGRGCELVSERSRGCEQASNWNKSKNMSISCKTAKRKGNWTLMRSLFFFFPDHNASMAHSVIPLIPLHSLVVFLLFQNRIALVLISHGLLYICLIWYHVQLILHHS